MPAMTMITAEKLGRLIGTPSCPLIIDVKPDGERLIPGSVQRPAELTAGWAAELPAQAAVIACTDGRAESPGVAAWLRHHGWRAEILDGGFEAWLAAGLPTLRATAVPRRDAEGRTVWVTRSRPKVDRIACPWLVRRFVDARAVFLFVASSEVGTVAQQFHATPFDVEGAFWSHRGELCTFDVMVDELGLGGLAALQRLSVIVRGADTARPDIAPQAAGLLAASLGLSRMYSDDLEQLEAGMLLYDAFYRWCRDATEETHDWESHTPRQKRS